MPIYPRLPDPPARQHGEGGTLYGYRLLAYLLASDTDLSVCLSDDQLDSATAGTTHALTMRHPIASAGSDPSQTPVCVYDRLESVRRAIQATRDRRAKVRAAELARLELAFVPPDSHPSGGRLTPLQPVPPSLPPADVRQPVPVRQPVRSSDIAF